jgi:hypothetical protein
LLFCYQLKVHQNRQGEMVPASHMPNSLPSLAANNHNTNNNTNSNNNLTANTNAGYYLPRQYIKTIPLVANSNGGFVISNRNQRNALNYHTHSQQLPGVVAVSGPAALGGGVGAGAQLSNRSNGNATGAAAAGTSETWSKPRLITIVRATEKPRKRITILLNRKALHSFEQFVCDISEAFGLPQWKNDKIRKLLTIRGRKVQGISDFFRDDDMFIGVSGKEPLKKDLIIDLLSEIYPDNEEMVQSVFKEWEASRSRSRAAAAASKARNNSLEYQNPNILSNSQNNNNKENGQSLNNLTSDNQLAESNQKSKYSVEFDENGRRKSKPLFLIDLNKIFKDGTETDFAKI